MYRPYPMRPAITVRGLTIDPPLVNGSGVVDAVSSVDDWNLSVDRLARLGAFVTKTVTARPRPGNPQPWAETCGEGSLVNAAGLPNPGIDAAMRDWANLPRRLGIPVIVSIGGAVDDLAELAAAVSAAGWAAGIECNLSCPNVHGGLVAGAPDAAARAVGSVRASTTLPLLAKLTPACGDPAGVARAVVAAGADAVTCGNTMPARAEGIDGGLSGRALHPIALRMVAEVAAAVDVPVIALGGVDGTEAAERMFAAGAGAIGVGTGAVFDPGLIERLAEFCSHA